MKVGKTPNNTAMYSEGFKAFVEWDDKSKSYYPNKKNAISEIRREAGRR